VLALPRDRVAEIHMRLGVVGPERDRLAVMRGGFVQPAQCAIGKADIIVKVWHALVERQRLADQVDRDIAAAGLMRQHAEQMQGVDMLRIGRQRLAIMLLRLLQPAGLMRPQRGRKLGRGLGGAEVVALRLLGHHGSPPVSGGGSPRP
jgi:hypothetical protein